MPTKKKPAEDALDLYRKKRTADSTPEPFGSSTADRPRVFVVHKHRASRLHYDLRLELGGVLKSWAVPKGPSFDPAVKRMAVFVEDHPVEYIDFEGLIPEGNYGAGAMIVWDRGTWVPLEDPEEGLVKGKILFELRGYKLRGVWNLVRTKNNEKEWLLIKKPDAHAGEEGKKVVGQESILSGLTVEELQAGKTKKSEIVEELEKLERAGAGVVRKKLRAVDQQVMLAETADQPFSREGWIFELKYDGFRLLTAKESGEPMMIYRRGRDSTKTFPDIARAVAKLPYHHVILDGEVVVLDDEARPSFQRLQKRVQLTRTPDIERAAALLPATLYVFDLLGFEDWDLRAMPLVERKRILKMVLPKTGPLRFSDHVDVRGVEMFQQVKKMKLEGIIAKKAASPYRGGRSADWVKIRVDHSGDFVIVGWVEPKGLRSGFGALHLALWEGESLVYIGRAGSGFTERELGELAARLKAAQRKTPPCIGAMVPKQAGNFWVEPELVCEVRYKEITSDGLLRQPVFLRMREDKDVRECVRDASFHARVDSALEDDESGARDEIELEAGSEARDGDAPDGAEALVSDEIDAGSEARDGAGVDRDDSEALAAGEHYSDPGLEEYEVDAGDEDEALDELPDDEDEALDELPGDEDEALDELPGDEDEALDELPGDEDEALDELPGDEDAALGERGDGVGGDAKRRQTAERSDGERRVGFSNLGKIFWPEEKYTKGDLIQFYREISPWLLPYLRDRPVVLTRYPDGIHGKSFFQKDAPPFTPGWILTERMWSEHTEREIDYFVANDIESLLFIINMGSIPLHVWSSRTLDIQHPDWCILDLDPKKAPFAHVVKVALAVRELCDAIELECFIKTSGSTGLHVLLPLGGQLTYEQSRTLGELMARIVVEELPEISTTTRAVGSRGTRVYIDYLQNGHGRLLVSPLCARPVAGALVSTPLEWSEVNDDLDFTKMTIKTVPKRLAKMKIDPMKRVLTVKPNLPQVLARLSKRLKPS